MKLETLPKSLLNKNFIKNPILLRKIKKKKSRRKEFTEKLNPTTIKIYPNNLTKINLLKKLEHQIHKKKI